MSPQAAGENYIQHNGIKQNVTVTIKAFYLIIYCKIIRYTYIIYINIHRTLQSKMLSTIPSILLFKPASVLLAASHQYVYVNDVEIFTAHRVAKRKIGKAIDIYASQCRKFLLG